MSQILLFPDPRPLVERLGLNFFRQAPECPGVYLMRDDAEQVLYVGKAKNLRKRLANYRVANPERMPRRHLRLLRAVARIDLEECADEREALAREAALLRNLRPRFNRAGTWTAPGRFLGWQLSLVGLQLAINDSVEPGWACAVLPRAAAVHLRTALLRLLWCAIHPERGLAGLPEGWFAGRHRQIATLARYQAPMSILEAAAGRLERLFAGRSGEFVEWIRERTSKHTQPFEKAVQEVDLETVTDFAERKSSAKPERLEVRTSSMAASFRDPGVSHGI